MRRGIFIGLKELVMKIIQKVNVQLRKVGKVCATEHQESRKQYIYEVSQVIT